MPCTIAISNLVVTQPAVFGGTGSIAYTLSGVQTGAAVVQPQTAAGPVGAAVGRPNGSYVITGLPDGVYTLYVNENLAGGVSCVLNVPFVVAGVGLDATPPPFAAAHLPCLLVARAAPLLRDGQLTPAPVLLCLDQQVGPPGNYVEVAQLRQVCDPLTNTARFDLSEYLKTLFTPTPPDELQLNPGLNDPALCASYRVRLGVAPGFTGSPGTESAQFSGLALNAAEIINPAADPLPVALAPPAPYTSVPPGYARFRTVLTGFSVTNEPALPEDPAAWPCPVRQFVWLTAGGAWVWGFFAGRHEHGTETGDGTLQRDRFGADRYVRRGDVRRTLRVYSDKLDFATHQHLVGLRDSVQVYERLPTGAYVPVLVEPGSFVDYQETNKTFTVDFTARYPVLARQTQ